MRKKNSGNVVQMIAFVIIAGVLLGVVGGLVAIKLRDATPPAAADLSTAGGVTVDSVHVKRSGTKFRYTFNITNEGTAEFSGSVTITLLDGRSGVTSTEATFHAQAPIAASERLQVEVDSDVGPRTRGATGIASFRFVVSDPNGTKTGEAKISTLGY